MSVFDEKANQWDVEPRRVKLASSIAEAIAEAVPLNKKMKAMEFGCGTGLVGMFLCDKLESILAVDNSQGMLQQLDMKISQGKCDNIQTHLADLAGKDDINGQFDLIFSSMVMHHIDNYSLVLKKLAGALKKGGYIAIADLDYESGEFHKDMKVPHDGFERVEFMGVLADCGFEKLDNLTAFTFAPRPEKGNREFTVFLITGIRK